MHRRHHTLASTRRVAAAVVAATAMLASLAATAADARSTAGAHCTVPRAPASYVRRVSRALRARRDVWGDRLLAAPGGPTYARAQRYLSPLLYASGPHRRPLTASGVYYVPFAFPLGVRGAHTFALHVADGSQILTRRARGRSLTILVGSGGHERFGSCLERLTPAKLGDGYLPILQTAYVDGAGVRYRQESFAARVEGSTTLVSFLHVTADGRSARAAATVRLAPSLGGLAARGDRLLAGHRVVMAFSDGGTFDGSSVRYPVHRGDTVDVYAAWLNRPSPARIVADRETYDAARDLVGRFWRDRLDQGMQLELPDRRVEDAARNLLIQQLADTWRYSVGNTYEELSFAEAQDVAQALSEYGFGDVAKSILRVSLGRLQQQFTDWRAGEILVATAAYYRLARDPAFVDEERASLQRIVDELGRQIEHPQSRGLLDREVFSSDIAREVFGLHGQAVVWQGLTAMANVWAERGERSLSGRARAVARRLGVGLRRAVRESEHRLPDGSVFVPAALLDGGKPFGRLTDTRDGSYWNLVTPYALASGFFRPHGRQADGLLRYMLDHGSRLLGMVRAGGYFLYGSGRPHASGVDEVYGVNVSRFLADEDEADQLVLTLYGTLAGAMTRDTFVSGEGATVTPIRHEYYRTMYLPPNSGGNAAFLETLRVMLVHETRTPTGRPDGLELAFATPRGWLGDGKRIAVRNAPTSWGDVSYTIERRGSLVHVTLQPPARRPRVLRLRLRLPEGERLGSVTGAGVAVRVERRSGTIDLRRARATVEIEATVVRASR